MPEESEKTSNATGKEATSRPSMSLSENPTVKEIRNDVFRMAWPAALENILVSLCGIVDMMMVGQLGSYATSAVGVTNQPKFLMLGIFIAFNVGCTALVARSRGEGRQDIANTANTSNLILSSFLSLVLCGLGYVFRTPLIQVMGGDALTTQYGVQYLEGLLPGLPFNILGLAITAALRGVGNTKASLAMNLTANLVNVFFNYCLIYGNLGFPRLEVYGAAIATSIGFTVSFVLGMCILFRKRQYVYLSRSNKLFDLAIIRRMVRVGAPAMLEQLGMRVGQTLFTRQVVSLGSVLYAAHLIVINIQSLSFTTGQAFGAAATTFVGQNLGRKRPDLAEAYAKQTRRLGMLISVALCVLMLLFARPICAMYSKEEAVIAEAAFILSFVAFTQTIQCGYFINAAALRGAGDTRFAAMVLLLCVLIIRPLIATINIQIFHWGLVGVWIAIVLDQMVRSSLAYLRFKRGRWKTLRV